MISEKEKMFEENSFKDEKKKYLSSFSRGNLKNGHDPGNKVDYLILTPVLTTENLIIDVLTG